MKKTLIGFLAGALLLLPVVASANTLSDLKVKLQSLLSQVAEVQHQIDQLEAVPPASSTPPVSVGSGIIPVSPASPTVPPVSTQAVTAPSLPCLPITHTLAPGSTDAATGGDVSALQRALAQYPSLYPEGLVTGYFGPATEQAVGRYQEMQNIVSSGTPQTTGFGAVGPATLSLLSCISGGLPSVPAPVTTTPVSSLPIGSVRPTPETLGASPVATVPGVASQVSIALSSLVSTSTTPTLSGSASSVSSLTVTIAHDGSVVYQQNAPVSASGAWSLTAPAVPAGSYDVSVRTPSGAVAAAGTLVVFTPLSGPAVPAAGNPGGTGTSAALPAPTVSVTANGSSSGATVTIGTTATIGWNSTNASSCAIASVPATHLPGTDAISGAGVSTGPLAQTTVFTVSCTGAGGTGAGSVVVTVGSSGSYTSLPVNLLAPQPQQMQFGEH